MIRVAIIGAGEQTKRTHLPCIGHMRRDGVPVSVATIVDYAAQLGDAVGVAQAESACDGPPSTVAIDSGTGRLLRPDEVVSRLMTSGIDAAVVATDPPPHLRYIHALERAGLPYLCDKPFVCPVDVSVNPRRAEDAIVSLGELVRSFRIRHGRPLGSVNITRRFGDSMRLARQLIASAELSHGAGVSYVSTQYSDGEQRDAAECERAGDHPFTHGYGALNHSGYHAVDTALWLAGLDSHPRDLASIEVQTTSRSVDDYLRRSRHLDTHSVSVSAEYDCVVNAKVRRHDGHSTLVSVASMHDSTSNRRWSRAQSADEKLHLGRLSNEVTLINQGELQNVLLRLLEIPHNADAGRLAGLPRRCMRADVTRNPLYAAEIGRPVYEDFSPAPTQRSLSASSKLRALQSFISKVRGEQYDENIDLDRHFLSQLVLLMAAQSVAGGGVRVVESADAWAPN